MSIVEEAVGVPSAALFNPNVTRRPPKPKRAPHAPGRNQRGTFGSFTEFSGFAIGAAVDAATAVWLNVLKSAPGNESASYN